MRKLLLLLISLCSVLALQAQQQTVTGTVLDDTGQPVIGATVVVPGTTTGTVTDIDGQFSLSVPEGTPALEISYLGYSTNNLVLTGANTYDVALRQGLALDEVIVTGYSVGTKREATGAISTIAADKLTAIPSGNVEQQLQGRASGVTVITNGQPGTRSKVRIRGFGSFNNNDPLYVVDGVPTNNIDFLPAEDIESTSILKDAASASIYGARASGGVVAIQTRRGTRNASKMRVTYDGLIGFTDPGSGRDLLTPQQQAEAIYQAARNDIFLRGGNPDTATIRSSFYDFSDPNNIRIPDFIQIGRRSGVFGEPSADDLANFNADLSVGGQNGIFLIQRANKEGTDWYDEITRQALLTRHNLGFGGGTDRGRYYFGLSYQNQEGILINNSFKRYVLRANNEFDIIPNRLRVGQNAQFALIQNLGQIGGNAGQDVANNESAILSASRISPLIPARVGPNNNAYGGTLGNGGVFGNARNPLAEREGIAENTAGTLHAFGDVFAELDIVKGLYFKTLFGGTYYTYSGRNFGRATYENSENVGSNSYGEFNGNGGNWVFTNTLNYDYKIGGAHSIKGVVGYEALRLDYNYFTDAGGINPFLFTPSFASIAQVASQRVNSGFTPQKTLASIFGQVNYNYQDKYYVTGTIRRDESSAFARDNRAGVFPAVSAAWRVTGEDFFQPTDLISDFKLRAGYGLMGNTNAVSIRNGFDLFSGNISNSAYDINGSNSTARVGFLQNQIGNPNAKWETSYNTNFGAELTMFNSKFDFVIDLWQKRNEDVLYNVRLPNVNGPGAAPFVNVATIDNKGIDLLVTYRDRSGDFNWEATVTGSVLKNEIVEIADGINFFDSFGQQRLSGSAARNIVGKPMSTFFGYQVIGLWQSFDEVRQANAGAPVPVGKTVGTFQEGAAPGRFRYADLNGVDENGRIVAGPDGKIGPEDRTDIGNAVPNFTGGLNLKLGYKGIDLETFMYTSLGNEIFNNGRWYTDFLQSFTSGSAKSTVLLDAWSPTNTDSNIPILENSSNFSTNTQVNSYYVEDGSFLRMQYLTLGYNLPTSVLGSKLSKVRLGVSGTNLFTITGYSGLDPGVGGAADTSFGIDVGNYPVSRQFMFNVSLGF